LALLPRFLHSFRTFAPLYPNKPSYIDRPDAFVVLHPGFWHGSFSKYLALISGPGRARKKVTELRLGMVSVTFFRGEILVRSMFNSF